MIDREEGAMLISSKHMKINQCALDVHSKGPLYIIKYDNNNRNYTLYDSKVSMDDLLAKIGARNEVRKVKEIKLL